MLLLTTHEAVRSRPVPVEDDHGWVTAEAQPETLTLPCNLQGTGGDAAVRADEAGGAGPNAPRVTRAAVVYLNPGADVLPGDTLTIGATAWQVRYVEEMPDPTGGSIGCVRAEVAA